MSASILASEYVVDTVGLVVRMEKRRLGAIGKSVFDLAEAGNITIYIPSMVFAEILYLSERHKIGISLSDVRSYLDRFANYKEFPMNFDVIRSASQITDIPELHDRLIAGTAYFLNLDLITNDQTMQASSFVRTVW